MSIKKKAFMITQAFEFMDTDDIQTIYNRALSLNSLKKIACIIHDKDKREDWLLKKPHFHMVLTFWQTMSSLTISRALWVEEQYVEKIKSSVNSSFLYLIHKNDPEKYQYNPKEVLSNFDYVDFSDDYTPKQKRELIAKRILDWEIKPYNLIDFVSIEEYAKNNSFYNNCFKWRQEKMAEINRNLECIYVYGPSWIWKTTYAKKLAENLGYSVYISSGWKKPLDDYKWQECIILDDIREKDFELNEFLKLTDNNTNSFIWCRYYNKSIAECKLIILTSIIPMRNFYSSATVSNDDNWERDKEAQETKTQLYRRFKTLIQMTDEYVKFFAYDSFNHTYKFEFATINPVSKMYDRVLKNDLIKWIKAIVKDDIIELKK